MSQTRILSLLILGFSLVFAAPAHATDLTLDQLIKICQFDSVKDRDNCAHYMQGFFDDLQAGEVYLNRECSKKIFTVKDQKPIVDWLANPANIKAEKREEVGAAIGLMSYLMRNEKARVPCADVGGYIPFDSIVERCSNNMDPDSPCKFYTSAANEIKLIRHSLSGAEGPYLCEPGKDGKLQELTYMPDEAMLIAMQDYLKVNPKARGKSAALMIGMALQTKYSCQK